MELFGTAGVRGPVTDLTPERLARVGRATALAAGDRPVFVLGRDGRATGGALADAVAAGLRSGGATVLRAGVLPTPALAHATHERGCRGATVTASHNPPGDNGLKLFDRGVEYGGAAERAVADRVEAGPDPVPWDAWGDTGDAAALDAYREAVTGYVAGQFGRAEGVTAVVDCGNGTAGLATPGVLRRLGADVVALDANVDGHFPARESKPTAGSLADCRALLADGEADLGIAHDGDADRVVVLDGDGDIVHEDTVVAILAERYVRASDADDPVVVTTPNASGRIDERVAAAGGRTERVALGALHEGIADTEGSVAFAAEPWKHVHPALGGWIDGVASAAAVAALVAGEGLDALRAPVTERPYRKRAVDCPGPRKEDAMARLRETLPGRFPDAAADTEYGVRLDWPDGSWLLVRPSGTEPCIRVYAESDRVEEIVAGALDAVEAAVGDG